HRPEQITALQDQIVGAGILWLPGQIPIATAAFARKHPSHRRASMPLDRHAKRILDMIAAGGGRGRVPSDPSELRNDMARLAEAVDAREVPVDGIQQWSIAGPCGPLAVRDYAPHRSSDGPSPALIYFHGGAGVFGSLDTHDGLCRILANASACRVLSVDYRLAPEHPFPASVEDSGAATRWIADHAADLGLDATRIGVGGDSHGGTLAATVCQQARATGGPPIAFQLLICPVLDLAGATPSRQQFATGYFLEASLLAWATELYCPPGVDRGDPRLSPLRTVDLAGLPPAYVHIAEFDPMRDEGAAYAAALERAGVPVSLNRHPGMIHHFYAMAAAIPYARIALESAGAEIGRAMAQRGAKNSV
ncbi:MAG: alpha/beta hydrolase, partial [Steroidobacteraceae bacterium]